jgi:hypothetical protein
MEHAPAMHWGFALGGLHVWPQPPQLRRLVLRFTSQPSSGSLLQSAKPLLHPPVMHASPTHSGVPFGVEHFTPQPPQFEMVSSSAQPVPEQSPWPGMHELVPHMPEVHVAVPIPFGQTWPHDPQSSTLLLVCASQPLATLPSQSAKPGSHTGWQTPDTQLGVALLLLQAAWQAPQLSALFPAMSTSHPFLGSPSQSAQPVTQVAMTQAPVMHCALA